ncbi:hypothetical protein [Mesorhizobium sp. WSM3873]|nr:hypothetical protein [Mesorhizobium sp. WSM3873]
MTGETIHNDGWCERARQTAAVPGLGQADGIFGATLIYMTPE